MDIKTWFDDVMPIRRKRASDWILPACAGLGLGVAAGIGIGLLFAPTPGEEARHRLREGASRMKDRAARLASKAASQVSEKSETLHLGRS
jgi:gas vesicle protein